MNQHRKRTEVEFRGEVTVVYFVDRRILDEQNVQRIGESLFNLVDELKKSKIILNFCNVEFLCAAMIAKLITLNKKCERAKGKLVLCQMCQQVYEVFEITKLKTLIRIVGTEQEAFQEF